MSLPIAPPSPNVSAPNQQTNQLLSNPNTTSIQNIQQYQRMGRQWPGGLATTGQAANWPTGGMSSQAPGLSHNPMEANQMQSMIMALQGQR
jgi:hypothetical protein